MMATLGRNYADRAGSDSMGPKNGFPKALQALMKRAPPVKSEFSPGSLVGRYRIVQEIGKGGHGCVYRALDTETSVPVAIKVLHDDVVSEELRLRMKREAYAMQQLAGTHAAAVYECSETATGHLYLVMEFLEGQDLETVLRAHAGRGQLLPTRAMLEILAPVVSTLQAAHERGISHRDLKPENIFVSKDGNTRLVDFGLVKDLNLAKLTEVGMVAGSPSYIAPEAWAGQPDKLDHRIDVYALGVIVFSILTGTKPFDAPNLLDLLLAVTTAPRPSLFAFRPDLHGSIDAWTQRALATAPEDRFQTVVELWDALHVVLAQSPSAFR